MATRFYFKRTHTFPHAKREEGNYHDAMVVAAPSGGSYTVPSLASTIQPDNSRQFVGGILYTERFAQDFTLSGVVNIKVAASSNTMTLPVRFRVSLSKVTAGGGDVETFIGQGDSTADIATSTGYTIPITPASPLDIVTNERLIVRVYAFPTGGTWGTGSLIFTFDQTLAAYQGYVELTETVTTTTNYTRFYFRRTTVAATAVPSLSSFLDFLPTKGSSAFTTAVVNTVASATEIQWTKTAGGAVAEWITPRFKFGWAMDTVDHLSTLTSSPTGSTMTVLESNASANVTFRIKFFRRLPDGTETLITTYSHGAEVATAAAFSNFTGPFASITPTYFQEDDRLVIRVYAIPAPTLAMGGGQTATIQYDNNATDVTVPTSQITLNEVPPFKLETDPARSFITPGGQTTLGIGNGQ